MATIGKWYKETESIEFMFAPLLVLCSAAIVYLLRPSNLALSSGASPPAPPFFLELLTRTRVRSCALIPTEVTHLSGSNVVKDTVLFRFLLLHTVLKSSTWLLLGKGKSYLKLQCYSTCNTQETLDNVHDLKLHPTAFNFQHCFNLELQY